jgi:GNAT superfamily N-acetyltransferase
MEPVRTTWTAADGTLITVRPIEPGDFALEQAFVAGLSAATGYKRLLSARRLSHEELRRFTEIDPECEFAVIATTLHDRAEQQVGVARYVKQGCADEAEFAIVLSDDWQGHGLGGVLLSSLIAKARQRGVRRLIGTTMSDNDGMLALARKLGFSLAIGEVRSETNLTLDLAAAAGERRP